MIRGILDVDQRLPKNRIRRNDYFTDESKKCRVAYFDNAKFALIFLVILGHMIFPFINSNELFKTMFLFIYSFHMPMFVIISGYFSKANSSSNEIEKNISGLFIPFFVFHSIYVVIPEFVVKGISISYIFQTDWMLWYFLTLFLWRVSLPYIVRLNHSIIIAFILAILFGFTTGTFNLFSMARTINYFPLFLIGYYLPRAFFEKVTTPQMKIVCSIILVTAFALSYQFREIDERWLLNSFSYASLGFSQWYAFFPRVICYLVSLLLGLSFLSLIPKANSFLALLGKNSMYALLWHPCLADIMLNCGLLGYIAGSRVLISIGSLIIIALALTIALSTRIVAKVTDKYLLNNFRRIFIKKSVGR
jgi:fucose 4-O-acetylase-like acetyltransferase